LGRCHAIARRGYDKKLRKFRASGDVAWAVPHRRQPPRHGLYSSPQPAPSSDHELQRAHKPAADSDDDTPGKYSSFIRRSLTFTLLSSAFVKHLWSNVASRVGDAAGRAGGRAGTAGGQAAEDTSFGGPTGASTTADGRDDQVDAATRLGDTTTAACSTSTDTDTST